MKEVRKISAVLAFLILMISFSGTLLLAQVSNNSIHNRSELILNTPVHSTTANSTVEWSCISKALTNKCLIYHNDQWFHFTPQSSGKFYLNVSSQHCRDLRGVQVVVIEGNPCEIKTYKMLECIPKIYQDDVFIQLDSLKSGTLYLVNIDGYLGDFCTFDITLSDIPKGLPRKNVSDKALNFTAEQGQRTVALRWRGERSRFGKIGYFEVYRLKTREAKSVLITTQYTNMNSLGIHDEDYFHMDTLYADGDYQYKIIGVDKENGSRELLDDIKIKFYPVKEYAAEVPINFLKKGEVLITIMDPDKNLALNSFYHSYLQPETLSIDLSRYVKSGSKRFWVRVKQVKTKQGQLHAYEVNKFDEIQFIGN